MVGGNVNIEMFDFQERAVLSLIDLTAEGKKQVVTVKSPTGSGKTIILINYIDEYLSKINSKTAFIWLCPGKGDLEEQSRKKMLKFAPTRNAQTLSSALAEGFTEESTTFINWELVTKTGNKAISDGERKNLFDRIAEAHRNGIQFIIIIDEEHSNNTAKAQAIIDAIAAKHIIRMSATATKNSRYEYYEIDEFDVIDAGLITKALYVNEGIQAGQEIGNDYDILLELADEKRKQIAQRYIEAGKRVRPLVLIQFPNGQPATIEMVEQKLEEMGYTYDNGMVSKWMSEDKRDIPDNLTENDATPVFLLMKQAISTGWDCPRAKILVKLREGMNEQFEIQTIGRIRRMPETVHYDDDLLDFCFVYTFDNTWKNGLLHNVRFDNVVHPSVVNYDDVQLETVHNTIQAEEAKIEETDQQRREQAHAETKYLCGVYRSSIPLQGYRRGAARYGGRRSESKRDIPGISAYRPYRILRALRPGVFVPCARRRRRKAFAYVYPPVAGKSCGKNFAFSAGNYEKALDK